MPENTQNDLEYDYRLLRIIEQEPSLTQRELAEKVGLSVGKTNYVLGALIDRGLVKAENFRRNKYKAGYIYLLTPKGISEKVSITARFLKRKMDEFDRLKAEIEEIKGDLGYTFLYIQLQRSREWKLKFSGQVIARLYCCVGRCSGWHVGMFDCPCSSLRFC